MIRAIGVIILSVFVSIGSSGQHLSEFNGTLQAAKKENIAYSNEIQFLGEKSIRFELNRFDKMVSDGMRSEVSTPAIAKTDALKEYSFSIFLPDDYAVDAIPEIVAQWHAQPDVSLGETWRSPPISLSTKNGRWKLTVMWATNAVNTNKDFTGRKSIDLGVYKRNEWTSWKFVIRFSHKQDGLIKVYRNGRLVLNRKGPNYYNDKKGPFFKYGLYKFGWNSPLNRDIRPQQQDSLRTVYTTQRYKTGIYKRVLYFGGVSIK